MSLVLVQTVTVGAGGAASIEFTGIPQDATDLMLVVSARGTSADVGTVAINGVTTNQSRRQLFGDGSSASSASPSSIAFYLSGSTTTANTFGSTQFYFANYRVSAPKTISQESVSENNATAAFQSIYANLWNVNNAITSIRLDAIGLFTQHSTASLYKITRA